MNTWDLIELHPNRRYRARLGHPHSQQPSVRWQREPSSATAEFLTDSTGAVGRLMDTSSKAPDAINNDLELFEITDLASDTSVDLRLFAAACHNSITLAREALRDNIDPNVKVRQGTSALHVAVSSGHPDVLEMLLHTEADIDAVDELGWTPLLESVKHNPEILRLLITHGADLNLPSNRGYTPLMRAASTGSVEAVKLLLHFGADPSLRDCDDKTAYRLSMETQEYACAVLVGDALCEQILLEQEHVWLTDGFELRPVSHGDRLMIDMTRRTVGGKVSRVYLVLDDNSRIEGIRLIDELVVAVPLKYASRKVAAAGIPFEQY